MYRNKIEDAFVSFILFLVRAPHLVQSSQPPPPPPPTAKAKAGWDELKAFGWLGDVQERLSNANQLPP